MANNVILLECFGICLTFVALLLLLNGNGAREQKLLIFIMCGSLVQNIGYLLELTSPTVEAAVAAVTATASSISMSMKPASASLPVVNPARATSTHKPTT